MNQPAETIDEPWRRLPRHGGGPVHLTEAGPALDPLFTLPEGSALTLARIEPGTAALLTTRWRGTGTMGFYPASTIKWITAAMAVAWMDRHAMRPMTVIRVGQESPRTLRDLILSMIVMSDNDAFNTLQEAIGFAETHQQLRAWGVEHGLIRRHFTRPHWNHSRPVRVRTPGQPPYTIAARPAANIPLSIQPSRPVPLGNPEENCFTTDDFVRVAAATLMGPTRDASCFKLFTQGLAWTNQCFVREGLARLTASVPNHPPLLVLNKSGWWPPDGANSELCYIHDADRDEHYLLAVYVQGTIELARKAMADAAEAIFAAIHAGELKLTPWDAPPSGPDDL